MIGLFIVTEKFLALSSQRLGNHVSRRPLAETRTDCASSFDYPV
jgi:hypothetical protein